MQNRLVTAIFSVILVACRAWSAPAADELAVRYVSHPPTRPLPAARTRLLPDGPLRFVDKANGSDSNEGTKQKPWKTISHAAEQLEPGDTLVLRGGVYFEHVTLNRSGTARQPITLRSYPGELAILDGGIAVFQTSPQNAWAPYREGAEGEFQSTEVYGDLEARPDQTNLLGNFGDSLVPLHGYRFARDMRSDNPYWNITDKTSDRQHVYCGPGLWYNRDTKRIHIRLAHTRLPGLGDDNYRGETDPRKLPLIVAGNRREPVLSIHAAQHIRLQDLELRGARDATLEIRDSASITLEGLTVYGGYTPIRVVDTHGFRMQHTACRGLAAPWTFRASLKYRAIESRLFSASRWQPTGADSRDFDIAYCEFTDSVDGVFVGNVHGVRFHHNLLDNISDDGIFLTANTGYDGKTAGGDVHIYQNHLSRCLTTLAFGVGHGRQKTIAPGQKQTGSGVWVYRNVFDFRRPVMYHWPSGPDAPQAITSLGRVAGDHGSPAWEPMWIYHNTILAGDPPRYDYGTDGLGKAMGKGTSRRVFNNIICQMQGLPGQTLPNPATDFQADGNLFWSLSDGSEFQGDFLTKFRSSPAFEQSRQQYNRGWTAHDRFADPVFVNLSTDWRKVPDLRLTERSPAVEAGVVLPKQWPDPLRDADRGTPDGGAIPHGIKPWPVGVRGRQNIFGAAREGDVDFEPRPWLAPLDKETPSLRVVIIEGYPAFDAPLVTYGLRRHGIPVEMFERTWLEPKEYSDYDLVVIDGSFTRAGIEPNRFRPKDLPHVRMFLESGGTLLLMRERTDLFATDHGRKFLTEIVGNGTREQQPEIGILQKNHPWVRHLAGEMSLTGFKGMSPLRTDQGEVIIGSEAGAAVLYRLPVGKGQLIYVGWSIAASLPSGRRPSTVEMEADYKKQAQVLRNILDSISRQAK